ncbi:MAG: 50S ribosomal protein L10 [Treponema sp.]|nr:50S ribosomal protein L10 [Treponema sp.]
MAIIAKKIQEHKTKAIDALKDSFTGADGYIFTEYRGLTVEQITNLRKNLRSKEAVYKVIKNNFARIAFEQLAAPDMSYYLVGPTAVAITPKDSNEAAKILFDFVREAPSLKVKGALIGGTVYDAVQTEAFSKLPGKLTLISMFMSAANGPVRNFAAALNDVPARLVRTIKAIADKKGEEGQGTAG